MKKMLLGFMVGFWMGLPASHAGEADVVKAAAQKTGVNVYSFDVTVAHDDTGWNHYANKWEVVGDSGTVYGTRILHHPHVDEQPFTRSLSGVKIPARTKRVTIRAHDSVHAYGGQEITIDLAEP